MKQISLCAATTPCRPPFPAKRTPGKAASSDVPVEPAALMRPRDRDKGDASRRDGFAGALPSPNTCDGDRARKRPRAAAPVGVSQRRKSGVQGGVTIRNSRRAARGSAGDYSGERGGRQRGLETVA